MISLEELAHKHFDNYANKITPGADWRLLSKERQYQWKLEIAENIAMCLKALEKELTIVQTAHKYPGGFERGWSAGQLHENTRLKMVLESLREQLNKELQALNEGN